MDDDYHRQQEQAQERQLVSGHQMESFNGINNEDEDDYYGDPHHNPRHQRQEIGNGSDERRIQSMSLHPSREQTENAGKLFVGGIAWETSEETFTNYFSKYGEITDAVIMIDRHTGRPRGFGFVTFADLAIADRVLEEEHIIDGRLVEVKRTVPREEMEFKGVTRAKKIFIGGIPPFLTEDELKEYFSFYGSIVEYQILMDHKTGRSRGFGFVTFESEDAVEKIFAEGKTHEFGGKQVEIKKAEPKRVGGDYGSFTKSYFGYGSGSGGYHSSRNAGGQYGGKMGREYDTYGGYSSGGYGGYNSSVGYGGSYDGFRGGYIGNTGAFYNPYGGYAYGFGFNGPFMYGGSVYGGSGYGGVNSYGTTSGYGSSKGYGRSDTGFGSSKGHSSNGSGTADGHSSKGYGGNMNVGAGGSGRYHPYQK